MKQAKHRLCLLAGISGLGAILLLARPAAGSDWTRFRGPNGRGVADAASPPTRLDPSGARWRRRSRGDTPRRSSRRIASSSPGSRTAGS